MVHEFTSLFSCLSVFPPERKHREISDILRNLWRKGPFFDTLSLPETESYGGECRRRILDMILMKLQ